VVGIRDCGPYGGGQHGLIDLSQAVAKRMGLFLRGTEWVRVLDRERNPPGNWIDAVRGDTPFDRLLEVTCEGATSAWALVQFKSTSG
jgi:hypothetical protein